MTDVHLLDPETGHFISQEHRRVAEIINEYDSTLNLVWIPPGKRTGESHPFAILHSPDGKAPYIVRKVRESEVNEQLIAWLWSNDTQRNDPVSMLGAYESAQEALRLKRQLEAKEEQQEIAETILRSPLNVYRHNGKTYRD